VDCGDWVTTPLAFLLSGCLESLGSDLKKSPHLDECIALSAEICEAPLEMPFHLEVSLVSPPPAERGQKRGGGLWRA
jgi:hypothetical protein